MPGFAETAHAVTLEEALESPVLKYAARQAHRRYRLQPGLQTLEPEDYEQHVRMELLRSRAELPPLNKGFLECFARRRMIDLRRQQSHVKRVTLERMAKGEIPWLRIESLESLMEDRQIPWLGE